MTTTEPTPQANPKEHTEMPTLTAEDLDTKILMGRYTMSLGSASAENLEQAADQVPAQSPVARRLLDLAAELRAANAATVADLHQRVQ